MNPNEKRCYLRYISGKNKNGNVGIGNRIRARKGYKRYKWEKAEGQDSNEAPNEKPVQSGGVLGGASERGRRVRESEKQRDVEKGDDERFITCICVCVCRYVL